MRDRGRLIVLEGGEASGKSTQAELLARQLGAELTQEPGGSKLGEIVRGIVLGGAAGELDDRAELLLFAAARAQHVHERLGPLLAAGSDVVCDRFTASTVAYQGYGRGLPLEDVLVACEVAAGAVQPDLNVLLELPPGLARSRRGAVSDRIEAEGDGFHERVVAGFRTLAASEPERWEVVDGSGTIEDVHALVVEAVARRLGLRSSGGRP